MSMSIHIYYIYSVCVCVLEKASHFCGVGVKLN